jgi:hypothetical protein
MNMHIKILLVFMAIPFSLLKTCNLLYGPSFHLYNGNISL